MTDPYFPQRQQQIQGAQKPVAREPNALRSWWENMLQPAFRASPAFRQAAPAGPLTQPNALSQEIASARDRSAFTQALPVPRATPLPAERATMARRGRGRAAGERAQQTYGSGAAAVQRHTTQPEREAEGHVRPELPREAGALLDVISNFEGTDRYPGRGYNTLVGGRQIEDLSRHPRTVGVTTSDGPSTAFGRYQFIGPTWDMAARALGLTDASPESQDRAAWWLAQRAYRGVTGRELGSDLQDPGRWDAIASALGTEWASFPGQLGRNQRQHDAATFRSRLEAALGGAAQSRPRNAGEFIGLERGFRATPRARNFEEFMRRPRDEPISTRRPGSR